MFLLTDDWLSKLSNISNPLAFFCLVLSLSNICHVYCLYWPDKSRMITDIHRLVFLVTNYINGSSSIPIDYTRRRWFLLRIKQINLFFVCRNWLVVVGVRNQNLKKHFILYNLLVDLIKFVFGILNRKCDVCDYLLG